MKQERIEILNMLKEGKISTEEAERLLAALEQREHQHHEADSEPEDGFFGEFPHVEIPFGRFRDFGRMFRGYGKTFGHTMRSAFGGMGFDENDDEDDSEQIGLEGLYVAEGTRISIRQPKQRHNVSGDILLIESEDNMLRIEGEHVLRRSEGKLILICRGNCKVRVPETCASVKVSIFSGNISSESINAPVRMHTMDGNIQLHGSRIESSCTTMSGNIILEAPEFTEKKTEVSTMSGNIEVAFRPDWNGTVEAATMSGNIETDMPGMQNNDASSFGPRKITVSGPGSDSGKTLRCMTMSGNIELSKEEE